MELSKYVQVKFDVVLTMCMSDSQHFVSAFEVTV